MAARIPPPCFLDKPNGGVAIVPDFAGGATTRGGA